MVGVIRYNFWGKQFDNTLLMDIFFLIRIISSKVPETLTQIGLSQKGNLVTHKNEKISWCGWLPGYSEDWVSVHFSALLSTVIFIFMFPFSLGGWTNPDISTSSEPTMEWECLLPNNFHKSPGINLTQAGELCLSLKKLL